MQVIDLFSGIGGFSLAAHWCGFKTVQFCEIDSFCQKVLQKNFPNVHIHNDIKTLGYETIKSNGWNPNEPTIIVGGFPCQPFSIAGKQRGKSDDRYLWKEMLRIVQIIKPDWVVCENVTGIVNMELDNCTADLEDSGYEVQSFNIPASGVGAIHKRERIWIVAHFHARSESKDAIRAGRNEFKMSPTPNGTGAEFGGGSERSVQGFAEIQRKFDGDIAGFAGMPDVIEPCFRRTNDGVSRQLDKDIKRNDILRVKALGNSIVPQIAYIILQAILLSFLKATVSIP